MTTPIPKLLGYRNGNGAVRVWCDHCRRFHLHTDSRGYHRAHCACPRSPYRESGYHVVPVDENLPLRRQRARCRCVELEVVSG